MSWIIEHAGLSDQGHERTVNEDRWCADPESGLYLVADGMGGVAGGGLASEIVVEILPSLLEQRLVDQQNLLAVSAQQQLTESLVDLSRHLRNASAGEPGMDGMGSTVVVAVVRPPGTVIGHMGNSRAYLVRRGELSRLTQDHSLVNLLVVAGEITATEAESHPSRGQLTRYVGMPADPLPEARSLRVQSGDRLLLCSDGLTDMVSDEQLRRLLQPCGDDLRQTCRRLVDTANAAGGRDNIAVVLISLQKHDKFIRLPRRSRA